MRSQLLWILLVFLAALVACARLYTRSESPDYNVTQAVVEAAQ